MTMKALEGTELVLRISGEVEQSNLKEFESQALEVIAGINTTLETDEDFSAAETNIKGCQLMENRIATARNTALANTEAIAELIKTTERLEAKFRETRLLLNGKVKTEKARRVNEIIINASNVLELLKVDSPARHGFSVDRLAINNAVKGKKSISKIQEAVDAVVDAEKLRLIGIEAYFTENLKKIERSEAEWPGLFPDKQNVALSAPETVEAMIVGRIADHRLKVAEKARREQEEKERKERAEAERIAAMELAERTRAEYERNAGNLEERVRVEAEREAAAGYQEEAKPSPVEIPIPEPFHDFPIPPPIERTYRISVLTSEHPGRLVNIISALEGVLEVTSEEI